MTLTAEHSLHSLRCDSAIFISDLHLSDQTPQLIQRFQAFCSAVDSQWLIIMGDLFEGYCGDDDDSPCIQAVVQACAHLHNRGVKVALMHGNRDFMIGHAFAQRCHALLVSDPCVLNNSLLLSHGDSWCTLDTGYQAFRAASREPTWQAGFLSQPLSQRQAQIQAYRAQSKAAQMDISSNQTDVVDLQVLTHARQLSCLTVLHGHTHRPSDRQLLDTDGTVVRKVVLGDWNEHHHAPVQCARLDGGVLSTFMAH